MEDDAGIGRVISRFCRTMSAHFNSQNVEWEIRIMPEKQHSPRILIQARVHSESRWAEMTQDFDALIGRNPDYQQHVVDASVRKLDQSWNHD